MQIGHSKAFSSESASSVSNMALAGRRGELLERTKSRLAAASAEDNISALDAALHESEPYSESLSAEIGEASGKKAGLIAECMSQMKSVLSSDDLASIKKELDRTETFAGCTDEFNDTWQKLNSHYSTTLQRMLSMVQALKSSGSLSAIDEGLTALARCGDVAGLTVAVSELQAHRTSVYRIAEMGKRLTAAKEREAAEAVKQQQAREVAARSASQAVAEEKASAEESRAKAADEAAQARRAAVGLRRMECAVECVVRLAIGLAGLTIRGGI